MDAIAYRKKKAEERLEDLEQSYLRAIFVQVTEAGDVIDRGNLLDFEWKNLPFFYKNFEVAQSYTLGSITECLKFLVLSEKLASVSLCTWQLYVAACGGEIVC